MHKKSLPKILLWALVIAAFATFLYYFNANYHYESPNVQTGVTYEKAVVTKVISESLIPNKNVSGLQAGTQQLEVKLLTGAHKGTIKSVKNHLTPQQNIMGKAGLKIIVMLSSVSNENYTITVYNYYRAPFWYFLIALFLVALCFVGGKKGARSVVGLVITLISVLFLFVPMLYRGYNPLLACILVTISITCFTLLLLNGWNAKTLSAGIGTISGVIIAGIIAKLSEFFAHLNGFNFDDSETLMVIANQTHMQIKDLLFAAVLVASIGAVMDVAISIASSIQEVFLSNSELTKRDLFISGMHVGQDMMGTMATTLILAFTGASLTVLILLYSYKVQFNQLMNMNLVGIELIQGISGSLSIIFTVPIISFICSRLIPAFSGESKTKKFKK